MLRHLFLTAAVVLSLALVSVQSALAAPPDRAAYNYHAYNPQSHSAARVQRFYVQPAATPVPDAAPAVAVRSTERRAYSVEPQGASAAASVAPVRRSYSYEPSGFMVAPSRRMHRPAYLLPKTDSGKFGSY